MPLMRERYMAIMDSGASATTAMNPVKNSNCNKKPLGNPPVAEIWLAFYLEPNLEKQSWIESANEFVDSFRDSWETVESIYTDEFRVRKRTAFGAPEELVGRSAVTRILVRDKNNVFVWQVGNDLLVVNMLRHGDQYPDFTALWNEAAQKLSAYVTLIHPQCVRKVELNYIDIIEIPNDSMTPVDLESFFKVGLRLPEEFGRLGEFTMRLGFPKTDAADSMTVVFSDEPRRSNVFRFRLEWHSVCEAVGTLDLDLIRQRLSRADEHLYDCFSACFTPAAWAHFCPAED